MPQTAEEMLPHQTRYLELPEGENLRFLHLQQTEPIADPDMLAQHTASLTIDVAELFERIEALERRLGDAP